MKKCRAHTPHPSRRNRLSLSGQALVEFALILPFLLLITLATIEFGRLLAIYSLTSSAAREATRYGTAVDNNLGGTKYYLDCAGMRQAARGAATALISLSDDSISVQYDNGQTLIGNCGAVPDSALESGDRIRVTVTTTFQPIVPLVNIPPLPIQYVSTRTLIKEISSFPECSDGIDNDGDGLTDYPNDPNCSSPLDNTEAPPPGAPLCWPLELLVSPSPDAGTATKSPDNNCPSGFGLGYADGTVVNLQATAAEGYIFTGWTGADVADAASPTTNVNMNALKTVTANFGQCYNLLAGPNDPLLGSVNMPAPNCPDGTTFAGGVTLTAVPEPGAGFVNWTDAGGAVVGLTPVLSLTLSEDKNLTANFTSVCHAVSEPVVSPAGAGSATIGTPPNCGPEYTEGSTVTVGASANLGWVFTGWTASGGVASSSNPLVLTVNGPITGLTAHFTQQCYSLTTTVLPAAGWGTITPTPPDDPANACGGLYPAGQLLSVTATPILGPFFGWSGDLTGSLNPATLLMNDNKSVTASFQGQLHISGIAISKHNPNGNNWYAQVTVTVVDANNQPVSGVAVTGVWTNDGNSWPNNPVNPPNTTNSFGQATFRSATDSCKSNNTCVYQYRVTKLAHSEYVYDSTADVGNPATVEAP